MVGNQSVILFRTHFLLNLLKNASFPTRMPIFVHILTCACSCAYIRLHNIIGKQIWNRNNPYLLRSKVSWPFSTRYHLWSRLRSMLLRSTG